MRATRWTGYLLLPIAFLLERSAWFAVRSILWEHIAGPGAEFADRASAVVRTTSWLVVLSPIAGAAVGYALGARRTLLIGMLSLCAGYLLLVEGSLAWPAAVIVALGLGLVRPAFLAVAGLVSPDPAETPRTTFFLFLYVMTTLAALLGPSFAGAFPAQDLFWVIVGAVALTVIATVAISIHAGVASIQRAQLPQPPRRAHPFAGAAVLLAMLFLAITVLRLGTALQAQSSVASQVQPYVHPVTVIVVIFLLGLVWIGISIGNTRIRASSPATVGLIVLAFAPVLIGLSLADPGWRYRDVLQLVFLVGGVALAAGEALVMPFLLSRISAGAPPKWSVAVAAAWLLATSLTSGLLAFTPDSMVVQVIALAFASLACLIAGIVLLVKRKRLRALFDGVE